MRVSVTSSEVEGGDVCIHYKMPEAVLVYSADEGHIIKGVSLCQDCILTILTPQNRHFQFSHIFFLQFMNMCYYYGYKLSEQDSETLN